MVLFRYGAKCKTTQFFKRMNPEFGHLESDGLTMRFRCSKDLKKKDRK